MNIEHENGAPPIYQEQQRGSLTTSTHEGHSLLTSVVKATPEEETRMMRESLLPSITASEPNKNSGQRSAILSRSGYIVIITLCYAALAIFAWVVTCMLTFKPIGAHHYGVSIVTSDNNGYGFGHVHNLYMNSELIYKVARTIQSIVAVLTIPIASAVCSRAAVVFIQKDTRVTMRQAMLLADKAWTDPTLIAKSFWRWNTYGSSFLFYAVLLNVFGIIISPLQEIFLSTTTVKTPTFPMFITDIPDFYDLADPLQYDFGYVNTLTRGKLATTSNSSPQSRLWSVSPDCNGLTAQGTGGSETCSLEIGHSGLANMSWLNEPFFSPLQSGFSTGLVRQFAPRINSTARRENIVAEEFPKNCDRIPGALYIRYANDTAQSDTGETYSVEVCMPANMTASPWKAQHQRQDFSEELYLNISLHNFSYLNTGLDITSGNYYSKITLNTTGGFFELPNYMNGEIAGPLIQDDPSEYCGIDCYTQGYDHPIYDHSLYHRNITSRSLSNTSEATANLLSNAAKGPLLTTALALFGVGSFIDTRESYKTYVSTIDNRVLGSQCISLVPFVPLLRDVLDQSFTDNHLDPCLNFNGGYVDLNLQVAAYLWGFVWNSYDGFLGERIQNAFTSAAFLANEAGMMNTVSKQLSVGYDLGADTEKPVLSQPGMIIISVMLGLYLLCLFALSVYTAWTARWTEQLDAFAMMRIGAAMGDSVPLLIAPNVDDITVLNELPGSIGDASGGEGRIGELAIGAKTPLIPRRRYRSY